MYLSYLTSLYNKGETNLKKINEFLNYSVCRLIVCDRPLDGFCPMCQASMLQKSFYRLLSSVIDCMTCESDKNKMTGI